MKLCCELYTYAHTHTQKRSHMYSMLNTLAFSTQGSVSQTCNRNQENVKVMQVMLWFFALNSELTFFFSSSSNHLAACCGKFEP